MTKSGCPPSVEVADGAAAHPETEPGEALGNEAALVAADVVPGLRPSSVRRYPGSGRRSAAYQVTDAATGVSLAVKRERAGAAAIEECIYRGILAVPGVDGIRCHGVRGSRIAGWSWLVTDHVEGTAFNRHTPDHVASLTRWLAKLHEGADPTALGGLPRHGAGRWRSILGGAGSVLDGALANPALCPEAVTPVMAMHAVIARVIGGWGDLVTLLDRAPVTLVHGDISHRNVKMASAAEGLHPMVFDWETGGLGCPMIDLAWIDLAAYEEAAPADWSALDQLALRRLQTLGVITWVAYVLLGERANLASPWPERAAAKVPAYLGLVAEDRLDELLHVGR